MAGYSKRSLMDKVGIKEGLRVAILDEPRNYAATLGKLPPGVKASSKLQGTQGFIHFFTRSSSELEQKLPTLKSGLAQDGMLWISWPKRSSGLDTDLSENIIRDCGLKNGLVDVKVCAIDETWSGLKFVFRLRDRK
jgi:hypothetical protein